MSDVFISWGGAADRATVAQIRSRLEDAGLSVFEYTRSMDAGDAIDIRIMQEINRARVAIVCLSDTSIPRQWVQNEIAWLHSARVHHSLRGIIPVQTGPIADPAQIPNLLDKTNIYRFDPSAAQSRETAVTDLVRAVFKQLGSDPPIPFPAVVLAMSSGQFATLGASLPPPVATLCAHLTSSANAYPAGFSLRYPGTALEFQPFGPGMTLVQVVSAAIREVNRGRVARNAPPVMLKWLNEELWSADPAVQQRAAAMLRSNARLLAVDALSMYHPAIQLMLADLPDLAPERTALIWVPPYSQWTSALQASIGAAAFNPARIRALFDDWIRSDWGSETVPWRAFDLGTPAALWHWLYWMANGLAEPRPQQPGLERMMQRYPSPPFNPKEATG